MVREIIGVYSSVNQLEDDLNEKGIKAASGSGIHFFTADSELYHSLNQHTSLNGSLLESPESKEDGGIHSLATAFDDDDGSIQLMKLEKELRDLGFSQKDAIECKTYLHKGMIVVADEV
jgi:hypothetical protein